MNNLKITRCVIGSLVLDVLGKVTTIGEGRNLKYRVDKPVVISFEVTKEKHENGQEVDNIKMGLSPFLQPYIAQDFVVLKQSDIFGDFMEPVKQVTDKYLELTSGIIVPTPSKLITP
jgi:hypothetical protein